MGFYRGPNIVTDGLIYAIDAGSERSYPGSGTTVNDLVGSSNGTLTNGVGFNSGNGGTFTFDSVDDYISFTNVVENDNSYTILMWIKPDGLSAGGSGSSKPNGTNRRTPIKGNGQWNPGIWLTSDYIRSHGATQYTDSAINWTTATWNMIGMTYDGTNVNNILGDSVQARTHVSSYAPGTPTVLLAGAEQTSGGSYNWGGSIADILIYDRVLTTAEIAQSYNALKSRFGL